MGWSCSNFASMRLNAISEFCKKNFNSQNCYKIGKTNYFYEVGKENQDGAITGSIYRMDGEFSIKSGSFRIEPNGSMNRGPKILRDVPAYLLTVDHRQMNYHGTKPPDNDNFREFIKTEYMKQYLEGGVNYHITRSLGYVPYPNQACVMDLRTGNLVAEWKAAMFEIW